MNQSVRSSTDLLYLVVLAAISIAMMVIETRSGVLNPVRNVLSFVVTPIQSIVSAPARIGNVISVWTTSKQEFEGAHERLEAENLKLKVLLRHYEALEHENANLRRLLSASKKVPEKALVADLLNVSLDPFTHKILVNRGIGDDVYDGQPVLDAEGIFGQVTEVMPLTTAITLITDPSHATPVYVKRNGLRAIAFGTGYADELRVSYLTSNADIKVGDILLSSGLGRRFPAGYPVATISNVTTNSNEAFLSIKAEPIAQLNQSKQVLLVWIPQDLISAEEPANQVSTDE